MDFMRIFSGEPIAGLAVQNSDKVSLGGIVVVASQCGSTHSRIFATVGTMHINVVPEIDDRWIDVIVREK